MVQWDRINDSLVPVKYILDDIKHSYSYQNREGELIAIPSDFSLKFWTSDVYNLGEFDRNNLISFLEIDLEYIEFWLCQYNASLCDYLRSLKVFRRTTTFKTDFKFKEIQTDVAKLSKDVAELFHKKQEILWSAKTLKV